MALFGFLRADEEEEKRRSRQGGVKNRLFNFLDDTLDVAEGAPEKVAGAGRFVRDLGVAAARAVPRTIATFGETAVDEGQREAGDAVLRSADQLRSLTYEERKKALQENEGLAMVLKKRGVADPSDANLDKLKITTKQETEQRSKDGFKPPDRAAEIILGTEPVQSYQTRREGYEEAVGESRFRDAAAPLSFLGVGATIGLDAPGSATKGAAKEALKKIKKSTRHGRRALVEEVPEATDATSSIGRAAGQPPDIVSPGSAGTRIPGEEFRQRGFLKTVQDADVTAPGLKQEALDIDPQKYQVKRNVDLVDRARSAIDTDYDAALERVKSSTRASDEDVAVGLELMSKAQREKRFDDAAELADTLDTKLRESGRAVQAASIYSRLTPEGMLRFAQKEIRKVKESRGFIDKLLNKNDPQLTPEVTKGITERMKVVENLPGGAAGNEAQVIKQQLEGSGSKKPPDIGKAIKESLSSLQKGGDEAEGIAPKVAKKVERAITPAKKKAIDNLVNELAGKINKEILQLPASKKTSPTTVLQEVLKRNTEAQDAFPEVKEILREKFAENPKALQALDNLFGAELGLPASSGTINRAIAEQLSGKEVKISNVINESLSKQRNVVDDVTESLIGDGVDNATAKAFAEDVASRLGGRMDEAKRKVLERMMQEAPERAKPTIIDKLNKLSNLGALDNKDYLDLARAKLDLPELDADTAKKLSELSQKLQDTPDQAQALTRETLELIGKQMPVGFSEIFDAMRYNGMLSSPRTQLRNIFGGAFNTFLARPATLGTRGLVDFMASTLTGKERQFYVKDMADYYKGVGTAFKKPEIGAQHAANSAFNAIEAAKEAWSGMGEVGQADLKTIRAFRNQNVPKWITPITRFMETQDRFFQSMAASGEYAVQKSHGVADDVAKKAAEQAAQYSLFRNAVDPDNKTGQGEFLAGIDKFTDTITKLRAKHPSIGWFVPFIQTPMNMAKQMVEYSPLGLATLKGSTRKTEQVAKLMVGTSIMTTAAKYALDGNTTWAVPKDEKERELFYASGKKPFSVRVGDTWVPMIYFGPWSYALALPAAVKAANDEAPMDASVSDRLAAQLGNQLDFFTSQTYVEGLGNFIKVLSGQDDATLMKSLGFTAGQAIPFSGLQRWVNSVMDPVFRKQEGITDSLQSNVIGGTFGQEAHTDLLTGEEARRGPSDLFAPYSLGQLRGTEEDQAQRGASTEFLKTLRKTSKARSQANEDINAALESRDYARAQKLADSYNTKLKDSFKPWTKKYGQYDDEYFSAEYNQHKIRLNRSSIAQRRYSMLRKQQEERSLINR